jgi:hypothetical protein
MILLLDIDNVVRDTTWRNGLIESVGWDAYHGEGIHDKPIQEMIELVNALYHTEWEIIGITGCNEKFKGQMLNWLINNEVPVDELLMRRTNDFRPTPEVKIDLLKARFPDIEYNQFVLIDDREDICSAFQELGVTALRCYRRRAK